MAKRKPDPESRKINEALKLDEIDTSESILLEPAEVEAMTRMMIEQIGVDAFNEVLANLMEELMEEILAEAGPDDETLKWLEEYRRDHPKKP